MKTPQPVYDTARAGFSLMEVMVAGAVVVVLMTMALYGYTSTVKTGREGSEHVGVIEEARAAEQRIVQLIQDGRAVGIDMDGSLLVTMADGSTGRLRMIDLDGDPNTESDNRLEFDPDINSGGDEFEVCRDVRVGRPVHRRYVPRCP